MQLSAEQYKQIKRILPLQRGNVRIDNLRVVNAILYVAVHGCPWPALPKHYGNWHTIYTRMLRWTKAGVLDRLFEELQRLHLIRLRIEIEAVVPSQTTHTAGGDTTPRAAATPNCIWLPRMITTALPSA